MTDFDAAPPVVSSYLMLSALKSDEIVEARSYGYIVDDFDPSSVVSRMSTDPLKYTQEMVEHGNSVQAWRGRMYVVWFCYVFDNFTVIRKPIHAVEELFSYFRSNLLADLAQRYAGAGVSYGTAQEIAYDRARLIPYHEKALVLLQRDLGKQS